MKSFMTNYKMEITLIDKISKVLGMPTSDQNKSMGLESTTSHDNNVGVSMQPFRAEKRKYKCIEIVVRERSKIRYCLHYSK